MLGPGVIQSLADRNSNFEVIRKVKPFPVKRCCIPDGGGHSFVAADSDGFPRDGSSENDGQHGLVMARKPG